MNKDVVLFVTIIVCIMGLFVTHITYDVKSENPEALIATVSVSSVDPIPNTAMLLVTFGNGSRLNIQSEELLNYTDEVQVRHRADALKKSYELISGLSILGMSMLSLLYVLWVSILSSVVSEKINRKQKSRRRK